MGERIVPEVPETGRLRIVVDTDAANEIDDLYALAIVLGNPQRFALEGIVATHFASRAGPESTRESYEVIEELLENAGMAGAFPVYLGSDPMQYPGVPTHSEGVDFIVKTAQSATPQDPLWVVGLGAATNLASALLKAPDIAANVRYVFHARSEDTWPERSVQFNVYGDIIAAKTLL